MAANIYRSSAVSNATYGTPQISGMICTGFSVSEKADVKEVKDDQGSVVAVAVGEPMQEIKIDGMRTGSFTANVGSTLAITMPASVTLGATTIVTGLDTSFAAEEFEKVSLSARSYQATLS